MNLNPIVEKDLRTRLRGWRSAILISSYVLLLTAVLYIYFLGSNMIGNNPRAIYAFNPRTAINAFNLLIVFQFGLLFLAVPALTATSISNERERQTLDLMLVTSTPSFKIVLGKIIVSVAHTLLLVVASMPVLGIVFFFGGISFFDILKLIMFYTITALFIASSGVLFSSIFRKNIVSIIVTYIFIGIVTIGPFIIIAIIAIILESTGTTGFNPTYRFFASIFFPSPIFGFISFFIGDTANYFQYYGSYSGGYGINILAGITGEINRQIAMENSFWKHLHPWLLNSVFNFISSVIMIALSSIILNPVRRKR